MDIFIRRYRADGFSLIEVLVAVVILSVGLLALSALQVSLVRVSAESKAQSAGLALAEEQLEKLRDFANSTAYQSVTDGNDSSTVGSVGYTRTWEIRRFVYRTDLGRFSELGDGQEAYTAAQIAALPSGSSYDTNRDFKRAEVTVSWTDATGAGRSVLLTDVMSSSSPSDSLLAATEADNSTKRSPQARFNGNPADLANVIPIVVGDDASGNDQSLAATDPKPQTFGTSGKVSTRFTVLNFSEDDNGFLINTRTETEVVTCRCQLSTTALTGGTLSPSYWDGDEWTTPELETGKSYGVKVSSVDQPDLCNLCCRDHHDKTGSIVKFDPFRPSTDFTSGNHNHYLRSGSRTSATFAVASNGNNYDEACRLVRVGGIMRVTTDPQLENLVLLNTTGSSSDAAIDDSTKTAYQEFVKDYIDSIWSAVGTVGTAQASLADYTPSPDGLSQTDPVSLIGAGQKKQLSGRAMFVDWISPEAEEKLDCVGATTDTSCQSEYPTYIAKSVFQVLPFLPINLTGLAEWSETNVPADAATLRIDASNDPIPTSRDTTYSRGLVESKALGNAQAKLSSYRGSVAMTDQEPISYHDKGIASDGTTVLDSRVLMIGTRNYEVSSATSPSNNQFVANIVNSTSDANLKTSQMAATSDQYSCSRGAGVAGTDPTDSSALTTSEHLCAGPQSTTSVTLNFSNYSYIVVTCASGQGNPIDNRDPTTNCIKNNGTQNSPSSVVTRYYKLCSLTPTTAIGQFTISIGTPTRTESNHPDTERTPVTITANAATALNLIRFNANFYPNTSTCP